MPEYLYVGTEPRHFPTAGVSVEPDVDEDGQPTGEPVAFETHLPIVSPLVLHADGSATTDAGTVVPNNATDIMDAPSEGDVAEPIAESTLEDLTQAELYELAQDLNLHGRSSMDKPQLIAALREAAAVTADQQAAAEAAIDAAVSGIGQTEGAAGAGTDDTTEE